VERGKTSKIYHEDLAFIHAAGFGELTRAAEPVIIEKLRQHGIDQGTVVELGCGSGVLLAALSAAGYHTVGIDSSQAMLQLARVKAPSADLRCQSLYDAPIPSCEAVVAVGEPLNYQTARQSNAELMPMLAGRISQALTSGGFFLFDLLLQLPETVTEYRTWREGENWAVLVDGNLVEQDVIARRIITFRNVAGSYRRNEETHHVRLLRTEDVQKSLADAGFSVEIHDSYGEFKLPPGRRMFEARRG